MLEKMNEIAIPGPGAAMAIAAAVAIYSAALVKDSYISILLMSIAVWFSVATLLIENLHKRSYFLRKSK